MNFADLLEHTTHAGNLNSIIEYLYELKQNPPVDPLTLTYDEAAITLIPKAIEAIHSLRLQFHQDYNAKRKSGTNDDDPESPYFRKPTHTGVKLPVWHPITVGIQE